MERFVGRGRVVVSAMQLSEREFVNWQGGFESLFNGGILRRPPREYRPGYYGELTLTWADPNLAKQRLDARLTTGLRSFSRDLGVDANYQLRRHGGRVDAVSGAGPGGAEGVAAAGAGGWHRGLERLQQDREHRP